MSAGVAVLPIITAIVAFEAGAQYCIKRSKATNSTSFFLLAIVLYALVCGCLSKSYEYQTMGVVNAVWSAASVLAIVSIGMFVYHETLSSSDIAGIISIIIGVFLIFIHDHTS
jgi:multidrug transporter EmrE-like cation transporter